MQDEAHVFDLLPGYALDCLDADDAAQVASHLATCPVCRAELESFRTVVGELSLPASQPPPSDSKQRLMSRIAELPPQLTLSPASVPVPAAQRQAATRRMTPIWAAAAVIVIAALGILNVLLFQQANNRVAFTGPTGMRAVALAGDPASAPKASGLVIVSTDGEHGVVVVDSLITLPEGQLYQVWLYHGAVVTLGPTFNVDDTGYKGIWIPSPDPLDSYTDILITIEVAGSTPTIPSETHVLSGPLHR